MQYYKEPKFNLRVFSVDLMQSLHKFYVKAYNEELRKLGLMTPEITSQEPTEQVPNLNLREPMQIALGVQGANAANGIQ
jgi:hypothetical protein